MTGVAVSRTMGPGNRWAYTLYRRTNGEMFVHALDTPNSLAVCIDLPKKVAARGTLHLSANLDGDQLRIVNGRGAQVARVAVQPNFGGYGGFHIVN